MRRDQDPVDDRPLIAALEDIRTRGAIGEASIVDAIAHADRFAALVPDEAIRLADLGSGGGIDVLLSARRVGPTGKAYGLDMTDDMLDLARARLAGVVLPADRQRRRTELEDRPGPRERCARRHPALHGPGGH